MGPASVGTRASASAAVPLAEVANGEPIRLELRGTLADVADELHDGLPLDFDRVSLVVESPRASADVALMSAPTMTNEMSPAWAPRRRKGNSIASGGAANHEWRPILNLTRQAYKR
jgi:hypothetical protein